MTSEFRIKPSDSLQGVRYEIRGRLARRAHEMQRRGYEIIALNIGNPAPFGFRTPETMRLAMIENLQASEGYCHQQGIFPAREAVVMQQQARGVAGVTADHVFMGNGVSELIDLTLRALLDPGDEVLVPSPDYPLWTASVTLNRGRAVHYPCPPDQGFQPDLEAMSRLVTPRTRALVLINPNNPTGAVYSRATLEAIARLAEKHKLIVFSDEIYDQMTYEDAEFIPMATIVRETLCATFSGLSKIYRACGYRVGWVAFSGPTDMAQTYLEGLDLLASLRLCSNVPGQWAVQTALGGFQSIRELVRPGGRLFESRQALIDGVAASRYLTMVKPAGAMYAFIGVDRRAIPHFDDQEFALELLEQKHVLVAPGTSFNTPYNNHFRVTNLPDAATLAEVFRRMEEVLDGFAARRPVAVVKTSG
ncbi:MAG: aminotransferase [Gammaproteobacteria bacterium]|nr:MAG: aminotransferase class I/II-fold pyridoxal phosphate-dependent enzyme [Pseudomonadota bacterium]MBC6943959.1 aminotransferase class I/II-fold pyridoxal phosphate-dependent enzyme [Gammaproteobacteria bacterium]MCE7895237.1 aminotransferase class I/II-fold pyridoxal phosphate-dependent enzyme [Gammaproteobacteria bacterium PRO8]MDL1880277.1 aminotransferase class I/II-fold pyridoxal phosphate-dependent enzyme [Gammaproteobacteria bacterium PRO2]MCL4776101.1 aminotransferase class I/II-fo